MEADLAIFTSVIVVLFILLGGATYSEFRAMNKSEYKGTERAGDADIFRAFLKKMFG